MNYSPRDMGRRTATWRDGAWDVPLPDGSVRRCTDEDEVLQLVRAEATGDWVNFHVPGVTAGTSAPARSPQRAGASSDTRRPAVSAVDGALPRPRAEGTPAGLPVAEGVSMGFWPSATD